jgi:hypothetical protein
LRVAWKKRSRRPSGGGRVRLAAGERREERAARGQTSVTPVLSPKLGRGTSSFAASVMKKLASGVPFGFSMWRLP